MELPIKSLITSSFAIVIALYGSWGLLTEVVRTILPCGILLVAILAGGGFFLRVPTPPPEVVEALLGKDPFLETTGSDYVIKTIAHRGAGLDAPENSLAAFKMCSEKGCDVIEFDVSLTKDEVAIVFHDSTLERMTGLNLVVNETNWTDLSGVDISVKHLFKDRFQKTNIPTLEEAVTQLLASGQRMFIDLKDNNRKLVKIICDLFKRHPELYSRAAVTSVHPFLVYLVRKADPKIVGCVAWRPYVISHTSYSYPHGVGEKRVAAWYWHFFHKICDKLLEWALPNFLYYIMGLSVLLLHKDAASGKSILDWRKKGLRVIAWTANIPAEKQYLARVLRITYLTDTLTGEATTHSPPPTL